MRFEFATATRIVFGPGTLGEIGPILRTIGGRALVVTGSNVDRAARLLSFLEKEGIARTVFAIAGEPAVETVRAGTQRARGEKCDCVIGFGGGSAIDAGKAIAALLTNPGDVFDYLEIIGRGKSLTQQPVPYVAIPTTAGTGAEVTRNAVLASPEHRVKVSLRSPLMLPRVALVDPELTYHLPQAITASTGLDALTQLIEPFVSIRANPLTDAVCREGLRRAARSLRQAYEHGDDIGDREDMAVASLFGGLALANAALGAVHGFAAPIGGMFPAPHGAVCAALLPHAMDMNLRALRQRAPPSDALLRFEELARILTGRHGASADEGIEWVRQLCAALHVSPLSTYTITQNDLPVLCEKAAVASSMKGNPIALTTDELHEILQRAL